LHDGLHGRLRAATIHGCCGVADALGRADGAGKQQARMPVLAPQGTQGRAGEIGQRHQSILMAFATADMHLLP